MPYPRNSASVPRGEAQAGALRGDTQPGQGLRTAQRGVQRQQIRPRQQVGTETVLTEARNRLAAPPRRGLWPLPQAGAHSADQDGPAVGGALRHPPLNRGVGPRHPWSRCSPRFGCCSKPSIISRPGWVGQRLGLRLDRAETGTEAGPGRDRASEVGPGRQPGKPAAPASVHGPSVLSRVLAREPAACLRELGLVADRSLYTARNTPWHAVAAMRLRGSSGPLWIVPPGMVAVSKRNQQTSQPHAAREPAASAIISGWQRPFLLCRAILPSCKSRCPLPYPSPEQGGRTNRTRRSKCRAFRFRADCGRPPADSLGIRVPALPGGGSAWEIQAAADKRRNQNSSRVRGDRDTSSSSLESESEASHVAGTLR